MELARIEIKAAEERFKKMISEKEDEVRKSRKIAQQNEDVQVCTKLINQASKLIKLKLLTWVKPTPKPFLTRGPHPESQTLNLNLKT